MFRFPPQKRRLAFVVGNGKYKYADDVLTQPAEDAKAVTAALRRLNFVIPQGELVDLNHDRIITEFSAFESTLHSSDVALIYYSGHAIQIDGVNYLLPIEADIEAEAFGDQIVSLQDLINRVSERVATTLVFLDACRENPYLNGVNERRERSAKAKGLPIPPPLATGPGLAPLSATDKAFHGPAFIAFAAAPGKVAWTGTTPISIFTEGLLAHIETTDLSIYNLMIRVGRYVRDKTGDEQEPLSQSSLPGPFFFSAGSLVWFAANIIGLVAFLVAIFIHSLVIAYTPISEVQGQTGTCSIQPAYTYITPIVFLMLATLLFFLQGLGRSYKSLRGEYEERTENPWARGLLGGYFGSLFAAPIITGLYYFFYDDSNYDIEYFGVLLAEIALACTLAGVVLGSLSYGFARRPMWLTSQDQRPPEKVSIAGALIGGVLAGVVVGPILTWYFGRCFRPPAMPEVLLPGSLLATAIVVFSIVTYSVERISYRKMWLNATASLIATFCVALVSGLTFLMINSFVISAVASVEGKDDWLTLVVSGLIIGPVIGTVLGSAIGFALFLVVRSETSADQTGLRPLIHWRRD